MGGIGGGAARVGRWASATTGLLALLFAVTGFFRNATASYVVCLLLPIANLLQCLAFKHTRGTAAGGTRSLLFADAAVLFAAMYCVCICIVYYVQVTFVRLADPPPVVLQVVQYPPPSAFFSVDILGYTFLGISTLFVGLSLGAADADTHAGGSTAPLRGALYIHFLQALVGMIIPCTPVVYRSDELDSNNDDGDSFDWMIPLYGWCLVYFVVCALLFDHFHAIVSSYEAPASQRSSLRRTNTKSD